MLSTKPPVSSTNFRRTFESPLSIDKPHKTFNLKPKGADMWKNAAKQLVSSRKIGRFSTFSTKTVVGGNIKSSELVKPENFGFSAMGCRRKMMCSGVLGSDGVMGLGRTHPRSYASLAEAAVASTTDTDEDAVEEIQGLLTEMSKEDEKGRGEVKVVSERRRQAWMMRGRKYKEQVRIETEAWDQAAKEYKELLDDMCAQKLAPNLPYMKTLFLGWFEPLRSAIEEEQELWRQGKNKGSYAPYIDQLPADMTAVITMHKLMGLLMTGGENGCAKVVQAACQIGEAVEQEVKIHKFLEKTSKKKNKHKMAEGGESEGQAKENERLRKKVTNLMKKQKLQQVRLIVKGQDDLKPWGQDAQAKMGSRLIELLMETAYIQPPVNQSADGPPDIRPAFRHSLKTVSKDNQKSCRRYGVIECDSLVRQGLEKTARHMVMPYMPMLVPPKRWSGYDKGGYLFLPSYIMRTHGSKQQREAVKWTSTAQLEPVFEALNTLGNTKWRTNWRVLNVIDRLWASGGRLAGLVDRDDVPLPDKPETDDETERKIWKWKLKAAKKENSERHSQRCDIELKLAVARKMKGENGFYYPHNLDFRGRAYPMHPYLNHLGSDLCRGILEFGEGRPLGKSGLRWLKIHITNLYARGGVDKLSYDGRISFTENHIVDIFDSADKPLEGRRWWLGAEAPFQCLAACINLTEALRSSTPETYISHMPVHQDGSCNGLQHYAALGRDKLGAAAVNLVNGDKPADVYKGIADRVLEIMQQDAKRDASDPETIRARLLVDHVDRKLVKQTVMTSVYGVTYIGARDQIKKRLKERGVLDDKELFGASCYAAKVTLTALGEMFQAARSIMDWLGDCAKVIASENHPVRWTTPLGLPVVQPYRKLGRHLIKTSLQVLTLQRETDKVMVKRQRTAFPPNFVHSLDGSHMMMTAIACEKAGLYFAGVHDSYWTHACDVDEMNRILREKFVELYEAPILEDLLESFQQSFPTVTFPPLPERGDFDLSEVLKSTYFFN